MTDNHLKDRMDIAVGEINRPEFADADPVQFARRFRNLPDREIASVVCSHIAWGNRTMICRDCNRLLELMGNEPHNFLLNGDIESIDRQRNIHRTFFGRDLQYMLRGLRDIYLRYPTLESFAASRRIGESDFPSWALAEELNRAMCEANHGKEKSERCLPQNLSSTPLKRLNMALRWLVRRDGIVDPGGWELLDPSQLYIPLDVHVANTSRKFGLLSRKSNDRKAVVELTENLRRFDPADPVKYDFALFGLGISGAVE